MKIKSGILVLSSLLCTVLSACGSQINYLQQPLNQLQDNVQARNIPVKSDEGLFEFITVTQRELFKAYDKNKSGFITKDELTGKIKENFESMDLDHNGKLTLKEASMSSHFLPRVEETVIWRSTMTMIYEKWIDLDHNNLLTRDEFLNFWLAGVDNPTIIRYFKTAFSKNDLNKNDLLDFSEYEDTLYQMWKNHIKVEITEDGWRMVLGKY